MNIPEENPDDYSPSPDEGLWVPETEAGRRLDQVLAGLLPRYSRNRLQGWIKAGQVLVDGEPVREGKRKVRGGESLLVVAMPDQELLAQTPEDIPLEVLFEDESLLVINKPAGMVVHPGSGNWSGTLMNALLHRDPRLAGVPRAGIVHRLDKDTSGLLVVARTLAAQTDLVRQLQARTVKREYLAVAIGTLEGQGCVDAPIGRHPVQRTRMAVVQGGKPAITHYRVLACHAGATLLGCRLETGRTHQIRVHMAFLGHPLLGDPVYGRTVPGLPDFPRQALHAARLGLIHPVSGASLSWEAPLPEDMQELLHALQGA
ncbi:23S rRNA pseudouridine(1911/1915/1917) synthase RluD [Azovibrio restrictus]|uniref:23S rRNA pseudouridine(1911/1915/1917) synthase RluD n=1 Tax=Azovibrio restrictus TaxID=146938 RepID=UPI0026F32483|nr:23S rRNA pseudouridine(1911/1915/1917) synthase RluD [Azovibrio restrictus]